MAVASGYILEAESWKSRSRSETHRIVSKTGLMLAVEFE